MCKSSAPSTSDDGQENVETSNYGLLNLSSSSMSRIDLGEILMIVLLILIVSMAVWYVCKKTKAKEITRSA